MSDEIIKFKGYYLEHRAGGHSKFYAIFVGSDGSYATNWGRIGTNGQSAINPLPSQLDASSMGEKQAYAKMSKGYQMVHNLIEFEYPEAAVKEIRNGRMPVTNLTKQFWVTQAHMKTEATTTVLKAYDSFLNEINRVLDTMSSETHKDDFETFHALDELWEQVKDKHSEAEVMMSLAKQATGAALVK